MQNWATLRFINIECTLYICNIGQQWEWANVQVNAIQKYVLQRVFCNIIKYHAAGYC